MSGGGGKPFGSVGSESEVAETREFPRVFSEPRYLGGGRRDVVSFEVKPRPGDQPEAVVVGAKRVLGQV